MFQRATVQSSYCLRYAVLELVPQSHRKVQARLNHYILRSVPVFPELQDYPTASIPVSQSAQTIPYIPRYREKEVEINTGGHLYEKWAKEKRYWNVPKGPLTFNVRYIDTGLLDNEKGPTVVALHGSPGSYDDFTHITRNLYRSGARIVSPCFPGLSTYKMGMFRHTPEEKREFVKDFLKKIDVPRVDMLICHSSSLFSGLLLTLDKEITVKSLCLLNPTSFDIPSVMWPFPLITFFAKLFEFPIGHQIAKGLGKHIVGAKKQLKGGCYEDHFLSAFNMVHAKIPERVEHFKELVKMKFPIMLAYSENDRLIAAKSSYKMVKMLVADESEISRYDEDGKLRRPGVTNSSKKVVVFEKGTHFLTSKHPDVLSDEVKSFLFAHYKEEEN